MKLKLLLNFCIRGSEKFERPSFSAMIFKPTVTDPEWIEHSKSIEGYTSNVKRKSRFACQKEVIKSQRQLSCSDACINKSWSNIMNENLCIYYTPIKTWLNCAHMGMTLLLTNRLKGKRVCQYKKSASCSLRAHQPYAAALQLSLPLPGLVFRNLLPRAKQTSKALSTSLSTSRRNCSPKSD